MGSIALDQGASGRVEYERETGGIVKVRFVGDIDIDLLHQSSDKIAEEVKAGRRRIMVCVAEANPLFTPIEVVDEFHRVFAGPVRGTKFAYVSPENLFGKHFMLIEAAAFNAGINVAFKTSEDAARDWLKSDS
ncbi:hypothetical protein [Hyphobacterium sp.]|uniref:hypothetical protein n=1 Tax=Hyphobacterium sp. TaxID=2004662 RepID=UPI003BABBC23